MKRPESVIDLESALDHVSVHAPCQWDNAARPHLSGWWAVATDDHGIVAYFDNEREALRYRLDLINRWLNG